MENSLRMYVVISWLVPMAAAFTDSQALASKSALFQLAATPWPLNTLQSEYSTWKGRYDEKVAEMEGVRRGICPMSRRIAPTSTLMYQPAGFVQPSDAESYISTV